MSKSEEIAWLGPLKLNLGADPEETPFFLTDGAGTFIGPYLVGTFDIAHGTRALRENHGAVDVYAVQAATLEDAKRKWRTRDKDQS